MTEESKQIRDEKPSAPPSPAVPDASPSRLATASDGTVPDAGAGQAAGPGDRRKVRPLPGELADWKITLFVTGMLLFLLALFLIYN